MIYSTVKTNNLSIFFLFLKPNCTEANGVLWLGATDITAAGTFTWEQSGKPLTFSIWSRGEPNDMGVQECTQMYCKTGEWDDFQCDSLNQHTMCEVIFSCN